MAFWASELSFRVCSGHEILMPLFKLWACLKAGARTCRGIGRLFATVMITVSSSNNKPV